MQTVTRQNYFPNRSTRRALRHAAANEGSNLFSFERGPRVALPFLLVHHAFEAQARRSPRAIAVEHLGETISYGELDRCAEMLAARLRAEGVRPGDNVGLFLERSIAMVVGILGTLKAGAAYVPQHVGVCPQSQLRHVIKVTGARAVLTHSRLRSLVPKPSGLVCIDIDRFMQANVLQTRLLPRRTEPNPDQGCFVLFTSGTTGEPNGVQVTHRNVCNILHTAPGKLKIRPGDRVAQLLSISFDMAAWEILGCLSHGGTLVIRGKSIVEAACRANILIATPSVLATIDPMACPDVRVVAVAGEPCPKALADAWASRCIFYNSCGPTETTIVNTMQRYRPGMSSLNIGKPTPNNTVYVLSERGERCDVGEIGEMWAGGDCVTAGYLGNEELTRERYRPDPFLGRGMMFRTRDLGRWTADGELEHHGRTDDQVKVRGFRVELDSVSRSIESLPACAKAVTLKMNDRSLASFVCPPIIDPERVQKRVLETLPYYCVPDVVIGLEELPMTSRGKIDKGALRELLQTVPSRRPRETR